ncbi:MAG: hypothetical protein IJK69_00005, partial [Oscillospiraceae bacterium]|nr:hypothetical protein [Oscillospiraceae bacterium]
MDRAPFFRVEKHHLKINLLYHRTGQNAIPHVEKVPDTYVSSVYWQDFFQQKASGTDGVAKARKWRQVQQSSARGFAPAALSCH